MGMSKRACQGGRTNSGELLSSPPMVTPLLTFSTACLTGIQAIPTLPLISPASPGIFSPSQHAVCRLGSGWPSPTRFVCGLNVRA